MQPPAAPGAQVPAQAGEAPSQLYDSGLVSDAIETKNGILYVLINRILRHQVYMRFHPSRSRSQSYRPREIYLSYLLKAKNQIRYAIIVPRNLSAGGDGSSPHPHLLDPSNLQPQTQPETHQQLAVCSFTHRTRERKSSMISFLSSCNLPCSPDDQGFQGHVNSQFPSGRGKENPAKKREKKKSQKQEK